MSSSCYLKRDREKCCKNEDQTERERKRDGGILITSKTSAD